MKVLMLSLDENILKRGSKSRRRMEDYGKIVDELHIIVISANSNIKEKSGNVFIYPTNHRFKPFYFWKAFIIGKGISCDLITCQDSFPTGVVGYLLGRIHHVPLQIQVHIDFFSPYFIKEKLEHRIYFYFAKFLLSRTDNIRVVSLEIKDYLVNRLKINQNKICVLPVFPDLNAITRHEVKVDLHKKYPQFDFLILMATRLVKQKNIGMAIKAVKIISKEFDKIGLIIAGSGLEESGLKNLSGNSSNIIFEPWADDIYSYYKSADLFLLTSNYEGWGLTVTEAMAAGLPVISTPVGCVNEVIKNLENGIVVPKHDSTSLAEMIKYLYKNPEKRKQIAVNGRQTINKLKPLTKEEYLHLYLNSFKMAATATVAGRVIFLDRDGVINVNPEPGGYVKKWEEFKFMPGAKESLILLAHNGYEIFLVTNQAGVGRGLMTKEDLDNIHHNLEKELNGIGVVLKGIYCCTHSYDAGCDCRKPKPGLLLQAAGDHKFNLAEAVFIGDRETDRLAAEAAGCCFIMVSKNRSLWDIANDLC